MVLDAAAARAVATSPERTGYKLVAETAVSTATLARQIRPSGCVNWCIAVGAIIIGAEIL